MRREYTRERTRSLAPGFIGVRHDHGGHKLSLSGKFYNQRRAATTAWPADGVEPNVQERRSVCGAFGYQERMTLSEAARDE